jgi:hypothetical protein
MLGRLPLDQCQKLPAKLKGNVLPEHKELLQEL